MIDNIIILPSFSLEPNKCSSYNQIFRRSQFDKDGNYKRFRFPGAKVKRQAHNFKISDNAYRNLKRKINWLYYLAKSKRVTTYSGKTIYNFKMAFLTFTLPSEQRHSTKEVTNLLFNTLLTELRQRTKMQNYVWRLEFQKNKNVHYHLVTDTYIDYFLARKIWNRICKNHGYVEPYQAKFQGLSLSEYRNLTDPAHTTPFATMAKRYAKGCKSNWSQPNSIDVKSVTSNKAIANYISKYFGKAPAGNNVCNDLDTAENSENLRLWFCSRSLSKLKSVSNFTEAVEYDIFSIVETAKKFVKKIHRYAITYYYDIHSLPQWSRKQIEIILRQYAASLNYVASG